jgi:hypothetical protein
MITTPNVSKAVGTRSRSDEGTKLTQVDNILNFPSALDIASFESKIYDYFSDQHRFASPIVLSFKTCQFIEIATLASINAFITNRARKGLQTTVALPDSKDVRDFMRIWNFPSALEVATGIPFQAIVRKEDRKYFGENKLSEEIKYSGYVPSKGVERLLSKRFFSLYTLPFKSSLKIKIIKDEAKRWETKLVESVLAHHLGSPEGYIPSRVIYECMSNAARHPRASFVQTASHFNETLSSDFLPREFKEPLTAKKLWQSIEADAYDLSINSHNSIDSLNKTLRISNLYQKVQKKPEVRSFSTEIIRLANTTRLYRSRDFTSLSKTEQTEIKRLNRLVLESLYASIAPISGHGGQNIKSSFLTIVFWDDGVSMIDTLKNAIHNDVVVRSSEFPEKYCDYLVKFENIDGATSSETIKSDFLPGKDTADYKILLATTFPGITCEPSGKGQSSHPDLAPELLHPGMGLFTLLNTVIDIFGGSVAFRTKNYFMNIKPCAKGADTKYSASIRQFPSTPHFLGNLLTIRLPLKIKE